jgi:hypothetical protein
MSTHEPQSRARDTWWALDFASAFLSPGVNSRAELVTSPRAYARNGAPRRWLGDQNKEKSEMNPLVYGKKRENQRYESYRGSNVLHS